MTEKDTEYPPAKCLHCIVCSPGAKMVKSYKAEIKGLRRLIRRKEKAIVLQGEVIRKMEKEVGCV